MIFYDSLIKLIYLMYKKINSCSNNISILLILIVYIQIILFNFVTITKQKSETAFEVNEINFILEENLLDVICLKTAF